MTTSENNNSANSTGKKTILLLDDDPDQRTVFGFLLKNAGYTVLPASDVQECLHLLSENQISLIVSDICMPAMSGMDLVSMMKSDTRNARIPIILMTAGLGYDEDAAHKIGASRFCPKEQFSTVLLQQVREILADDPPK